jgi:hypothetical protein
MRPFTQQRAAALVSRNGLMLSATDSAICSFEMMPMISDGVSVQSCRIEPKSQAEPFGFSPTLMVVSLMKV